MKWKRIGFVGVDSGQLMITDPCYLADQPFKYDEICDITLGAGHGSLKYKLGHEGLAVVTGTVHGDGCYDVYGLFLNDDDSIPHAMMVATGELAEEFLGLTEEN